MLFRRTKLVVALAAVFALGLLAAGCGGGGNSDGGNAGGGEGKIVVEATGLGPFSVSEIKVKAGEPVTIVFKNSDSQLHDITVDNIKVQVNGQDQTGIHVAADAGAEAEITFTPTEAGEYEFYCSVPGHKAAGMVGKLIVE